MLRKSLFLGAAAFVALLLSVVVPARAASPGTAAGAAALSFDPFNPTAAAPVSSGKMVTKTVPPGGGVVVPPVVPVERTPGDVPTVYINISDSPTIIQSATGNTTAVFTVTLSGTIGTTVTVDYATADGANPGEGGGAEAGEDYVATTGTLTFPPFATTAYLTVNVLPEAGENQIETFVMNLSNAKGALVSSAVVVLARSQGVAIIQPSEIDVAIGNAPQVQQSTTAYTYANFPVTLSTPATTAVTVHYATADGSALANLDYIPTSGTVTFPPGVTSQNIQVTVLPENKTHNEIFYVNLSNATGAPGVTITNNPGSAEIRGQNSEIFVSGASAQSISTGTGNIYALVTLDHVSTQTISVNFFTTDGTAKANVDYKAVNTTVTFTPGQFTKSVAIPLIANPATVPTRTFTVNLGNPVTGNGWIEATPATMTILGHAGISTVTGTAVVLNGKEGRTTSGTVASFSSSVVASTPGNFTASIAWGDSSTSIGTVVSDGGGNFHVTGTHTYSKVATFGVAVTITYTPDGAHTTVNSTAKITDSPLDTPAGVTFTQAVNTTFTSKVLGTFRDQDAVNTSAAEYAGTINWGDGTANSAAAFKFVNAVTNTGSNWQIVGTHKYTMKKPYTVTIVIHDVATPAATLTITTHVTAN